MYSAYEFGASVKLVAIAILLLATQCATQPTPPKSRNAPWSASINGLSAIGSRLVVLQSSDFQLSLELDAYARCAITVRRLYSSPLGRLVWTANYFAGSAAGSTKCTLKFTRDGDLQLYQFFRSLTSLAWSSKTALKEVTQMTLQDKGNFQLLTAANKAIFSSFDQTEFAIVDTQKLSLSESLKSPDVVQPEGQDQFKSPVLLNQGDFVLEFKSGDLELRTTDAKPLVYWSLKKTLFKGGDLSKVSYAGVIPQKGGIGVFTAGGKLVWGSSLPPQGFFGDAYFGIDKFGNLKDYYMYKGETWFTQFKAIAKDCDLPNFCGLGSVCSKSKCSCPPKFVWTGGRDIAPFCTHPSSADKCNWKSFVELKGHDTVFDFYATPSKVSLASCKASCLQSCNCDGFSYDSSAGSCYQYPAFKTIRKVSDTHKSVFVKVT